MNNLLTGAAMGAALTTAGVYDPNIILSQFNFSDSTMLQTFLSAAAGSTLVVTAFQTLGFTALPPRGPSCLRRSLLASSTTATTGLGLGRYDGNLLGGALLGVGMAVSGACPGTALAQLGVGVRSGQYALAGAVVAGVAWSWVSRRSKRGREEEKEEGLRRGGEKTDSAVGSGAVSGSDAKQGGDDGKNKGGREGARGKTPETLYEALGVSRGAMLVALEAAMVLAIAATARYTGAPAAEARGIPPYLAGLAIAGAQLVSMVLRGSLLGASSAFEDVGSWLLGAPRKYANVLFSAGLVGGAWLTSSLVPALRPVADPAVSTARAALGGFLMVFGARMAGGCTSGHGISGLSLMSISSFLTAAALFGAAGLTGLLIG